MKRVFNLLVVDESGSMSIIERQALVGINETLTTIQKMQKTHKEVLVSSIGGNGLTLAIRLCCVTLTS